MQLRSSGDRLINWRLLGLVTIFVAGVWVVVVGYVIHSALPFNALRLPREESVSARLWGPQGWKFFTRNPREDWLLPYVRSADGAWLPATEGPNARVDALWGISRRPRAQGIEIALLLHDEPKGAWHSCAGDPVACIETMPIQDTIKNRTPDPSLCGVVGIVIQSQLPWAWRNSSGSMYMPSRVSKFEVKC